MKDRYNGVLGDYDVICDKTGFKVKASECSLEWNGSIVRKESWEPRQGQDIIRSVPDKQSVPIARSEPANTYVSDNSGFDGVDVLETLFPPTHGGSGA